MARFLESVLALDRPGLGLIRGRQLVLAAALALASATFWTLLTDLPWVGVLTLTTLLVHAWYSPREPESAASRIGISFLLGGSWAAVQLLLAYRF